MRGIRVSSRTLQLRPTSRLVALAILGITLSIPPQVGHSAWPHSPFTNLPVCTAANEQSMTAVVSDGAGGAFVAWQDFRSGSFYDIYAQHILSTGTLDPLWPPSGLLVCGAANNQFIPAIVSDGSGGAIVAWTDLRGGATFDVYAQHVLASGVVDPVWPVDGRAISTAVGNQEYPSIVSDGIGGAILTWHDLRTGDPDIYAQRVLAMGVVDPAWPVNGRALCTVAGAQQFPKLTTDGAGGAIVTWHDSRSASTDIYAQRVLATGAVDAAWPTDGRAICAVANTQINPRIAPDGAGGAYIAWQDGRSGVGQDIYALHVLSSGAVDPAWTFDGNAVCTAVASQINVDVISDGVGGAVITWQDNRSGNYDIYAHHLKVSGVDPGWPVDGRVLCAAAGDQQMPVLVSDGAGGAIVSWQDYRSGAPGVYAQHVLAAGTVDGLWPANGLALSTASSTQPAPRVVSDGAGGAVAAWTDSRSGNNDVYAQRVARFAYLGTPEAEIAGVTDVPNDEGGQVKVSWDASYLDTASDPNLAFYEIWRSVPGLAAEQAVREGALRLTGFAARPEGERRTIVFSPEEVQGYWEYLGQQSAVHYIPGYAYIAATTGDSTGAYNPPTEFMIVARNASGTMYWLSTPASGYSVDNLAPLAPKPFTGEYAAGVVHLHWEPNAETDLAGYRLYRGDFPDFVPSQENLIAAVADTGYVDGAGAPFYYKLSAVDSHGNESVHTTLLPFGAVPVEGAELPKILSLAAPSPNPALGSTTLRWSLPRAARVNLTVYDVTGRRVRHLVQGTLPAGEHAFTWDLRDEGGVPVASGRYYLRLEAGGEVRVRPLATLR